MRSTIAIALTLAAFSACMDTGDPEELSEDAVEQDATTCGVLAAGAAPEAQHAVQRSCSLIGTAYSWGGGHGAVPGPTYGICDPSNGAPNDCHVRGLDCSGMVRYAYYLAVGGDVIPGSSAQQYQSSRAVARYTRANGTSVLRPGDLVFFGSAASTIHHVAMYIGAGMIVESPFSGGHVRMVAMSIHSDYYGAIRLYRPPVATGSHGSSAVIDKDGTYHVFSIDHAGVLQQAYYTGGAWHWQALGGTVSGTPAVTYNAATGRFDVFAINPTGHLYQKTFSGGIWHGWGLVGGSNLTGGTSAVIDKGGTYHAFVVTSAGVLYQAYYSSGWHWQALGGTVAGTPGVAYDAADDRFDVFASGTNGALYQQTYSAGWHGWHIVGGGNLRAGATPVIDHAGTYHVFTVNTAGMLYQAYYTSGAWHWQALGGTVGGTPGVTYNAASNRYDVFAHGTNGAMYQKTYSGTWGSWHSIGGANLTAPLDDSDMFDAADELEMEAN